MSNKQALHFSITAAHLRDQIVWALETFGPDRPLEGLLDHIIKEVEEIRSDPTDLKEWIDLIILAVDGASRYADASGGMIVDAYHEKMATNINREWPDWRTADRTKAIEHVRGNE